MIWALWFWFIEWYIWAKKALNIVLIMWIIWVLSVFFIDQIAWIIWATPKHIFFIISIFSWTWIWAIQSSSRAIVWMMAPKEHSAQIFWFWWTFWRIATILWMSFWFLSDIIDSRRISLLLILAFFIIWMILLWRIPLEKWYQTES